MQRRLIAFGILLTVLASVAADEMGTVLWDIQLGGYSDSSPAIGKDGIIYVGSSDNRLYAIDRDGVKKWAFKTRVEFKSSPAIGADGWTRMR